MIPEMVMMKLGEGQSVGVPWRLLAKRNCSTMALFGVVKKMKKLSLLCFDLGWSYCGLENLVGPSLEVMLLGLCFLG